MRADVGLADGTSQGKVKRINKFHLRLYVSGVLKAGRDEDNLLPVQAQSVGAASGGLLGMTLGAIKDLFSGDIQVVNNAGWDKEARLTIVQDQPLPATVLAIIPEITS